MRLLVGPANFAGQGWAWGRAAQDHLVGVGAVVMAVQRPTLNFPADYSVPEDAYRHPVWGKRQRQWVERSFTHVLIEAARPLTGWLSGDTCARELPWLRAAGVRVALVGHGSEIRLPSLHGELYPHSPFDPDARATRMLQAQVERCRPVFLAHDGPVFVATPDLIDFVPGAAWLPTVVDGSAWECHADVLTRRRPVVLHVPSNPLLKGTAYVDLVLQGLHDRGVVEYRRLEGVPIGDMPALVKDADLVVDQIMLGAYGVMAVQAMFAGKVVLAHVADRTRARVPFEIPVVEADPESLAAAMAAVLDDRDAHRALARRGREFAQRVHGGVMSARVLGGWLGTGLAPGGGDPA